MPSPKSRECWNPAVPPPPVAGAAVGNGLGVAEGLADGVAVGVIVGLADGVGVGVIVGLADGVTVGLTVPGENGGGVEGPEPEQPETAAEANMVKAAQPTTARLAPWPVPMMVVRIFMQAKRFGRPGEGSAGHSGSHCHPSRARPAGMAACRQDSISRWPATNGLARGIPAYEPRGIVLGRTGGKVTFSRLPELAARIAHCLEVPSEMSEDVQ
jgi:hypothetical protein